QLLRFPTFTTAIYDQFRSSFNGPAANVLAGVLAAVCLVFLLAELGLRGGARYGRLGSGAARSVTRIELGRWHGPALGGLALLSTLALLVPLGALLRWLLAGRSTAFPWASLARTAATTVGLAAVAAVVAVALALALGWLSERYGSRLGALLERGTYFGSAMPGIVVALALITVSIRLVPGLYQSAPLLILGYAILFLPRAVINVRSALSQARPLYDDVARSLGTPTLQRLRRVTLPLMAGGLGAGAALVFLAVATELTATLLLAPTGTQTLATAFWGLSSSLQYGAAAPYAALMIAISAPATYLLTRQAGRSLTP
ncbi:MAG: ABC transporter permease, partial [Geodermatophilaceae bacterium]